MSTRLLLALVLVATGCAGSLEGADDDPCRVTLGFTPSDPFAGPAGEINVTADVQGTDGVLAYSWSVRYGAGDVEFENAQANNSAIRFVAENPGTYEVTLDVDAPADQCPQARERINVRDPNGTTLDVRLHVTPPFDLDVPPIDRLIRVYGATDYDLGAVVLDPGIPVTGLVRTGGTGVPAYLVFTPAGMPGAIVETFSSGTGAFDVTLLNQAHDVLVIPSAPGLAPQRFTSWSPTSPNLSLSGGTPITGIVRHGATPVAGAKVQLTIDDVPTELGTTAADGSFSVLGHPAPGETVVVEVTPAAASGLPRLEARGAFSVGGGLTITYNASLTTRNLGGTTVRRAGTLLANRKVTVVGALAAIGTVQAGTTVTASGYARIAMVTDAGGALPSRLAPAGLLSAVVAVDAVGLPNPPAIPDLAVTELDLTAGVPASINAAAMQPFTTLALGQVPLDGVRVELVPQGPLALAGTPTVQLIGDSTGRVTTTIAAGGTYDAYFSDPLGRSGQRIVPNVATGLSYQLDPAVTVSGTLSVQGNPNKIRGASVQILCAAASCTGIQRDRPIAEVASDSAGDFVLAVPDPGTM